MSDQFIRKWQLQVASQQESVDLSPLRFHFRINQSDIDTPTTLEVRCYNVSSATAKKLSNIKEYTDVILNAGYENGNYGTIFAGTIKQTKRGRESATDTFFDIFAAIDDLPYNFGVVNISLGAGQNGIQQQVDAIVGQLGSFGVSKGSTPDFNTIGTQLARGKVLYGMAKDQLCNIAKTTKTSWSIQNHQLQMIPLTSYLPGEAVVLTMKTGMIGLPEQTQDGIRVKCLLNPRIVIGSAVKIDNASIQRAALPPELARLPAETDPSNAIFDFFPPLAAEADGLYRVLVNEMEGDTRGGRNSPWYSDLTCLAINQSAPANQQVPAFPQGN